MVYTLSVAYCIQDVDIDLVFDVCGQRAIAQDYDVENERIAWHLTQTISPGGLCLLGVQSLLDTYGETTFEAQYKFFRSHTGLRPGKLTAIASAREDEELRGNDEALLYVFIQALVWPGRALLCHDSKLLTLLTGLTDTRIDYCLVRNPNTPSQALDILALSKVPTIRSLVASHPNSSFELVKKIVSIDNTCLVAALKNPTHSQAIQKAFVEDPYHLARGCVARATTLPDVMEKLEIDDYWMVKANLLKNENLSAKSLTLLRQDKDFMDGDPFISGIARSVARDQRRTQQIELENKLATTSNKQEAWQGLE